jgi:hypothetical protein
MSTEIKGIIISFEHDVSEEYANAIADAVRLYKGVSNVEAVPVEFTDYLNRERVKRELMDEWYEILKKK